MRLCRWYYFVLGYVNCDKLICFCWCCVRLWAWYFALESLQIIHHFYYYYIITNIYFHSSFYIFFIFSCSLFFYNIIIVVYCHFVPSIYLKLGNLVASDEQQANVTYSDEQRKVTRESAKLHFFKTLSICTF